MNNEISPGPSSTYADAYKLSFLISLNWIVLFLQFANSHFISSLPSFSWHFFSLHFLFTFLERLTPPSFIPGLTILPASMFDYCLDLLPMWDFTFVCKINEKKKPKDIHICVSFRCLSESELWSSKENVLKINCKIISYDFCGIIDSKFTQSWDRSKPKILLLFYFKVVKELFCPHSTTVMI